MTKYRLNRAENAPITLYNVPRTKDVRGKKTVAYSNYIRLAPNKVYESDDEAMLNFFRTYKRKVRYTEGLEATLKSHGVAYETEYCRTCGGRVKKISYKVVEVFDE